MNKGAEVQLCRLPLDSADLIMTEIECNREDYAVLNEPNDFSKMVHKEINERCDT